MTAKAWGRTAIAAGMVSAALTLPVAAQAQAKPSARGNPTVLERLGFWGTNGYGIEVNLLDHRKLSISASAKRGPGLLITNYALEAPQRPGSNDIKASLGKLGRIDVHFVGKSIKRSKPTVPVCKGVKSTLEIGRFVGLIEFRGDRGYTRARVNQARGGVAIEPAPSCRNKAKHGPHRRGRIAQLERLALANTEGPSEAHIFELKAETKDPPVEFQAQRASLPGTSQSRNIGNFFATAYRNRGRVQESSSALNLLVSGPYLKVPDLEHPSSEAIVEPPRPFLGSATFRHAGGDGSWTGDLRVNLPGFGVVPLAGPATEATFCADSGCHLPK